MLLGMTLAPSPGRSLTRRKARRDQVGVILRLWVVFTIRLRSLTPASQRGWAVQNVMSGADDGRLEVDLSVPEDMGGQGGAGTNPEQLFAVGYAACFQSALLNVANGRKLDASDSSITSRVGLGPTGHGGMGPAVALDLHAPHLSPAEAADLMTRAHELCPYSNATRGNIDVNLTVDGVSLQGSRAA